MPDGRSIHFETVGGRTTAIVTPVKSNKKKPHKEIDITVEKDKSEVSMTNKRTQSKRRRNEGKEAS